MSALSIVNIVFPFVNDVLIIEEVFHKNIQFKTKVRADPLIFFLIVNYRVCIWKMRTAGKAI